MTQISNHTEYVNAVNEAKLHDYRYFTLNAPTITDEEYDRLYFAIQDYETAHAEHTLPDSPTQSAHAEVKNGHKQIRRRTEMLSTEKAQTIEKVQKWMKKTTKKTGEALYTVEWKYDGVSVSLVYINGQLTEASYGKGMEGNDCLAHCLKVASIPNTIPASGRVEVRGEMVVPFANLKKTGYKNCRSAASGIMADTASTLTDCLEFHPYWAEGEEFKNYATFGKVTQQVVLNTLGGQFGFLHPAFKTCKSMEDVEFRIKTMTTERPSLPIPTDGLVIKVADIDKWDSLGRNDHHPHYAIAYKFAAATAETTIKDIQINVGKTGKRTPVAYFEPIVINGATYQKASIGSEAKLAELGIEIGSRVIVSLRNDVIPHIDKSLSPSLPEGEGALNTPAVEEPIVIADSEIEAPSVQSVESVVSASEREEKENQCASVVSVVEERPQTAQIDTEEEFVDDIDDTDPIAPYIAPAAEPVTSEPFCAPVIEPSRPKRQKRERHYRMVNEPRARVATASVPEQSEKKPFISYVFAFLFLIAIGVLLFASLGAAVFLLPLLAGAFK